MLPTELLGLDLPELRKNLEIAQLGGGQDKLDRVRMDRDLRRQRYFATGK